MGKKNISVKDLKKLISEEEVRGLSVTNKTKKESGKYNKQGLKDAKNKLSDYFKAIGAEDQYSKEMAPNKYNYDDSFEKTYHDEMEILNGQEMNQYDSIPDSRFQERAKKAIEGSSDMGNNPEWANVIPKQQGFTGPDFGKNLVKRIEASAKKRGEDTPAISLRGRDIQELPTKKIDNGHKPYAIKENNNKTQLKETMKKENEYKGYSIDKIESSGMLRAKSQDVGYLKADTLAGLKKLIDAEIKKMGKQPELKETMKRLVFKKDFNGVGNALKLIPESYKVDKKVFEMTDGNENYRIRWEGNSNKGKAVILIASDRNLVNEDMQRMKQLFSYKSQDTLGTLKGNERIDENKKFSDIWSKTKSLLIENEDMDENVYEYTVPDWALPALINDDFSGLDDEDEKKVREFIKRVKMNVGNANFYGGDEEDDLGFVRSTDIDNLGTNAFKVYVRKDVMGESGMMDESEMMDEDLYENEYLLEYDDEDEDDDTDEDEDDDTEEDDDDYGDEDEDEEMEPSDVKPEDVKPADVPKEEPKSDVPDFKLFKDPKSGDYYVKSGGKLEKLSGQLLSIAKDDTLSPSEKKIKIDKMKRGKI